MCRKKDWKYRHQNVTSQGEIVGDIYLQILRVYFYQRKNKHNAKAKENSFCKRGKKLPVSFWMWTHQPFFGLCPVCSYCMEYSTLLAILSSRNIVLWLPLHWALQKKVLWLISNVCYRHRKGDEDTQTTHCHLCVSYFLLILHPHGITHHLCANRSSPQPPYLSFTHLPCPSVQLHTFLMSGTLNWIDFLLL